MCTSHGRVRVESWAGWDRSFVSIAFSPFKLVLITNCLGPEVGSGRQGRKTIHLSVDRAPMEGRLPQMAAMLVIGGIWPVEYKMASWLAPLMVPYLGRVVWSSVKGVGESQCAFPRSRKIMTNQAWGNNLRQFSCPKHSYSFSFFVIFFFCSSSL